MSVPASTGGINALSGFMEMAPNDSIYSYNIMPSEYGLRLRKGYREWATGVPGDVRSIINYESNSSLVADKLWAVSENGIYDVTAFGTTAPVEDFAFAEQGPKAGWGNTIEFTSDASEHYLFYADYLNGLVQYTDVSGTWEVPTGWTMSDGGEVPEQVPFPVADIAFITVHKLRIWVILENSSDAWYLPVASIAGELKKFSFGSKATHGGRLMGLWDWTIDGGDGVDDYLLALMKSGDLIVYRGSDPEADDWSTVGSWFIGQATQSRRVAAQVGGELYMLSSYGITSVRNLLSGSIADVDAMNPSAKIARFLRADIATGLDRYEWALELHPADGFLQVVAPEPASSPYIQYNQNVATKAWGIWQNVPSISVTTWNGDFYMGGVGGIVYVYDSELDGTTLSGSNLGDPIPFSNLTAFQDTQQQSTYKRVGFIRPIGVVAGQVSLNVVAVYDYNVETTLPNPVPLPPQAVSLWNSAYWNQSYWDSAIAGASIPIGSLGMGRSFAIGMSGFATARITIVGWDVTFTSGGFL